MNKIISISFAFIVLFGIVCIQACKDDKDCAATEHCVNGTCENISKCNTTLDCLNYGLYSECSAGHCIPSEYKMCFNDNDCRREPINKKCVNYQCR